MGSSPRVRGPQVFAPERIPVDGIIPAGAGLTLPPYFTPSLRRDHPRGCGAHALRILLAVVVGGSSPRVRGSRAHQLRAAAEQGIIPAGAGLTSATQNRAGGGEDHPRGCGAHVKNPISAFRSLGSSPRVRGSRADDDL